MKKIITIEMVEKWLGTSEPEAEAIEILMEIANGEYKPNILYSDIIETIESEET